MNSELKVPYAILVYQGGIANVFAVEQFALIFATERHARRLFQGDFDRAQSFAIGLGAAGTVVRTAYCNEAGDITNRPWQETSEHAPFSPPALSIN